MLSSKDLAQQLELKIAHRDQLHIRNMYYTRLKAECQHIASQGKWQQVTEAVQQRRSVTVPMLWSWLYDLCVDPIENSIPFKIKGALDVPDIDIDFSSNDIPEIAMKALCGDENVFHVATFSTFSVKVAVRDICRALSIGQGIPEQLTESFPDVLTAEELDQAIATSPKLTRALWDEYSFLPDVIKRINGMVRHIGQHSAGRVYLPNGRFDLPLVIAGDVESKNKIVAVGLPEGTSSRYLGELGYVKFDYLGLKTLRILKYVAGLTNTEDLRFSADYFNSMFEDAYVFDAFCNSDTDNIFQFSSEGMKEVLRQIRPRTLEELAACNALYRPGSSAFIPEYVDNKDDPASVRWLCPEMKSILAVTHNVIVYQEQISQVFIEIGGFTPEEAEDVRKILKIITSANPTQDYLDKWVKVQAKFIDHSPMSKEVAAEALEVIKHYAGYSFNKSHSLSYAILAMQTMWYKLYYPLEFAAAIICAAEEEGKKGLRGEALRQTPAAIMILPPSIHHSDKHSKVDNGCIRLGLSFISDLREKDIDDILQYRAEVSTIEEHVIPALLEALNKTSAKALTLSNSLSEMPMTWQQMMDLLNETKHYIVKKQPVAEQMIDKMSNFERDIHYFEGMVWSNPFSKLRGKVKLVSDVAWERSYFNEPRVTAAIFGIQKKKLNRGNNKGSTFYIIDIGDDRATADIAIFNQPEIPPEVGQIVELSIKRSNGRNTASINKVLS